MKKVLATALWPCLLQDVLNRRFTVQNKPAAVAPKETITHHFFVFIELGEENCRCNKICGGAESHEANACS